jgi:hypothetical protein
MVREGFSKEWYLNRDLSDKKPAIKMVEGALWAEEMANAKTKCENGCGSL